MISRTDWSGETPATVFFLYDGNCNLDAVVDEGGNLVRQFTYDVFGAVRETLVGSGAETVGFSGGIGHITDLENSLVYMRARYYDPALGRFISLDPGRNGLNHYVYCGNNPVNAVDDTGKAGLMSFVLALAFAGFCWLGFAEGHDYAGGLPRSDAATLTEALMSAAIGWAAQEMLMCLVKDLVASSWSLAGITFIAVEGGVLIACTAMAGAFVLGVLIADAQHQGEIAAALYYAENPEAP